MAQPVPLSSASTAETISARALATVCVESIQPSRLTENSRHGGVGASGTRPHCVRRACKEAGDRAAVCDGSRSCSSALYRAASEASSGAVRSMRATRPPGLHTRVISCTRLTWDGGWTWWTTSRHKTRSNVSSANGIVSALPSTKLMLFRPVSSASLFPASSISGVWSSPTTCDTRGAIARAQIAVPVATSRQRSLSTSGKCSSIHSS